MNDDVPAPLRRLRHGLTPFPPEVVERYERNGSWRPTTLAQEFAAVANRWPDRIALECDDVTWTYAELDALADRRAAGLVDRGLRPGSPVLLQVDNSAEAVLTWYALLKAALVPVCTLAIHRRHEIGEIARQVRPLAHVVDADHERHDLVAFALDMATTTGCRVFTIGDRVADGAVRLAEVDRKADGPDPAATVAKAQADLLPSDVAVLQLSGGTTGMPKVIPRLHAEYWFNAREYARRLEWDENVRMVYIGPVAHNAGIICGIHGPHSVGGRVVLGRPQVDAVFDLMAAAEATDIGLGSFAFDVATDPRLASVPSLRRVLFSGKKVPPTHFGRLAELGIWSGQLFGMGEGLCMVTPIDAPPLARLTTVGTPLADDDEVRIVDPATGEDVAPGETGELWARGPYTLRGYFNSPEHNARAFSADGYYRTGDLAAERVVEGATYYSIEGRIKDLINRGGEKINAEEMELLLVAHPGIRDAALVAMPDERLGERACAFLVARAGALSLDEIREHLQGLGVAKYKWPERVVWVDDLPRGGGLRKVDKKGLRERARTLRAEAR